MNKIRKTTAVILLVCMLASLAVSVSCSSTESVSAPRVYIALGDSVSAGFGVAPDEIHTAVFFNMLKEENYADEYINMARNGLTTSTLLEQLKGLDDPELLNFKNARVITINIGGNNMLAPFIEHLPDMEEFDRIIAEINEFASEAFQTVMQVINIPSEAQDILDNFSLFDILDLFSFIGRVIILIGNVPGIITDAAELEIVGLLSVLTGAFSPELEESLQKGVQKFSDEFDEILNWLDNNAPKAEIIVNTVYNPIPKAVFNFPLEISGKAESLMSSVNDVILNNARTRSYFVSDVNTRFNEEDNMMDLVNFYLDLSSLSFVFDIVHPNSTGHKIIAGLNYDSYKSFVNS